MSEVRYLIWSEEHGGWWRASRHGYTRSLVEAGRFSSGEAAEIVAKANAYVAPGTFNEIMIPEPL